MIDSIHLLRNYSLPLFIQEVGTNEIYCLLLYWKGREFSGLKLLKWESRALLSIWNVDEKVWIQVLIKGLLGFAGHFPVWNSNFNFFLWQRRPNGGSGLACTLARVSSPKISVWQAHRVTKWGDEHLLHLCLYIGTCRSNPTVDIFNKTRTSPSWV